MELVLLLGGIAVGAVVLVIGLLVLIASLGAIQDWLSGVNGHRRALVARGVSPVLADAIAHELGLAQGGLAFALIGVVFGVPVLALGVSQLRSYQAIDEQALYVAPGAALLLGALFLIAWRRARLTQSEIHARVFGRAAEVIELVPASKYRWVIHANLPANAMGMRERRWEPVPHVLLRYRDGTEWWMEALHPDAMSTVAVLTPHLPSTVVVGPFRPATNQHQVSP